MILCYWYCVSFGCTAKWVSYMYTYIHCFFRSGPYFHWTKLGSSHWYPAEPIYWHQGREEGKYGVYCKAKQGKLATHAQKTWTLWGEFLKTVWGMGSQDVWSAQEHSSVTGWQWSNRVIFQESESSVFWFQLVWGFELLVSMQLTSSTWWGFRIYRTTQGYGSGYYL